MSDPYASPKKSINTEQDIKKIYKDWTDIIQCCTLKEGISYGFLPAGTDLFRSRSSAVEFWPDPVAWFGIHSTCASGAYGSQMYHFKTLKNLGLIDMSDVNTIERLRTLIKDPDVLRSFDKSFRIISPKGGSKYILRATEKFNDLEAAKYLKHVFKNNQGINGWFHKRIRKSHDTSATFHPEIMLFDVKNISNRVPAQLTEEQEKSLGVKYYEEQKAREGLLGKRRLSEPTENLGRSSPPRKAQPPSPVGTSQPPSRPPPRRPSGGLPRPDPSAFN